MEEPFLHSLSSPWTMSPTPIAPVTRESQTLVLSGEQYEPSGIVTGNIPEGCDNVSGVLRSIAERV